MPLWGQWRCPLPLAGSVWRRSLSCASEIFIVLRNQSSESPSTSHLLLPLREEMLCRLFLGHPAKLSSKLNWICPALISSKEKEKLVKLIQWTQTALRALWWVGAKHWICSSVSDRLCSLICLFCYRCQKNRRDYWLLLLLCHYLWDWLSTTKSPKICLNQWLCIYYIQWLIIFKFTSQISTCYIQLFLLHLSIY